MNTHSSDLGAIRSQFQREKKSHTEELKNIIRDLGLKVTHQRIEILEILKYEKKHSTAQGLYEEVKKGSTKIGFATVYRFLRVLAEAGHVSEVRVGNLPARYEWKIKDHHDHLTCIKCGAVTEFESERLEQLQVEIAQHFGYELTDHLLEMQGICPSCQKKSK